MKQPTPPKVSFLSFFLITTLISSSIIFIAAIVIKHQPTPSPQTPRQRHINPIITPCDYTPPSIPAVKHPAHTFKNANIVTVMEKIKDWYNIQYAYKKPINNRFTGTIPADVSIDEALQLLEKMSPPIRFLRMDTRQIIVNPICP